MGDNGKAVRLELVLAEGDYRNIPEALKSSVKASVARDTGEIMLKTNSPGKFYVSLIWYLDNRKGIATDLFKEKTRMHFALYLMHSSVLARMQTNERTGDDEENEILGSVKNIIGEMVKITEKGDDSALEHFHKKAMESYSLMAFSEEDDNIREVMDMYSEVGHA